MIAATRNTRRAAPSIPPLGTEATLTGLEFQFRRKPAGGGQNTIIDSKRITCYLDALALFSIARPVSPPGAVAARKDRIAGRAGRESTRPVWNGPPGEKARIPNLASARRDQMRQGVAAFSRFWR